MSTMTPAERSEYLRALSPTNLQYVSAIRGYVPNMASGYNYCMLNCGDGEALMALAASNPNGMFFGFDGDANLMTRAAARAAALNVSNVAYAQADALALLAALKNGQLQKPEFDYVVLSLVGSDAPSDEMKQMMDLASQMLTDGGLFYVAYDTTINDISELNSKSSRTQDAVEGAGANGLSYIGSAKVKQNYLEFSVPEGLQPALMDQRDNPQYETLKDLAMKISQRHDVWIKGGEQNADPVARFGEFLFAVTTPSSYIDPQFRYFDKKLDLTTPLFTRMINALSGYPLSIGDMIVHEDLKSASTEELLGGVMMLVATGIAEPAIEQVNIVGDVMKVKLNSSYNVRLRDEAISGNGYLAAPNLGRPVYATPTTLMCLKALDAAGIHGAEDVMDDLLAKAPATVKAEIQANLDDDTTRRNAAYRFLEQVCQSWLGFTLLHGVMKAS